MHKGSQGFVTDVIGDKHEALFKVFKTGRFAKKTKSAVVQGFFYVFRVRGGGIDNDRNVFISLILF